MKYYGQMVGVDIGAVVGKVEYITNVIKHMRQQFPIIIILLIVLSIVISFRISYCADCLFKNNAIMIQEIKKLTQKTKDISQLSNKKNILETVRKTLKELQVQQIIIEQIFIDFTKLTPQHLFLTSINKKDNQIFIHGISSENAAINSFIQNLNQCKWFTSGSLVEVKTIEDFNKQKQKFIIQGKFYVK